MSGNRRVTPRGDSGARRRGPERQHVAAERARHRIARRSDPLRRRGARNPHPAGDDRDRHHGARPVRRAGRGDARPCLVDRDLRVLQPARCGGRLRDFALPAAGRSNRVRPDRAGSAGLRNAYDALTAAHVGQ